MQEQLLCRWKRMGGDALDGETNEHEKNIWRAWRKQEIKQTATATKGRQAKGIMSRARCMNTSYMRCTCEFLKSILQLYASYNCQSTPCTVGAILDFSIHRTRDIFDLRLASVKSKRLISYLANKGSSSFSQNTVSVLVTGITFFRAEVNLLLVWQGWPSSFVTITITVTTLLQITPDSPRVR